MTEKTEDTETFTVTLTTPIPAVTCTGNSPHYGNGCALLKHYAGEDGTISLTEATTAIDDWKAGTITQAELDFVTATWNASGSINAKCPGCYAPAQGLMDNFTYPVSVKHGEYFEVHCDVHNTGGSSGTFKLRYSINGTVVYTGARWNIPAGGVTEGAGGVFAPAPATGSSMTVKLELIRET